MRTPFQLFILLTYLVILAVLLNGCSSGVSGTYLASGNNAVCWLELVRTADGRLAGQMNTSVMNTTGEIKLSSAPILGAIDGNHLTFTESRPLGLDSITFSGSVNGSKLILTGGGPVPLVLARAELSEYQQRVSDLSSASAKIIATAKAEAANREFVANLNQTVARMARFETEAELHLSRFPNRKYLP